MPQGSDSVKYTPCSLCSFSRILSLFWIKYPLLTFFFALISAPLLHKIEGGKKIWYSYIVHVISLQFNMTSFSISGRASLEYEIKICGCKQCPDANVAVDGWSETGHILKCFLFFIFWSWSSLVGLNCHCFSLVLCCIFIYNCFPFAIHIEWTTKMVHYTKLVKAILQFREKVQKNQRKNIL